MASPWTSKGETVAIFGPSGGGKTILLRLIAGVLDPDEGDIRIDGRSVVSRAAGSARPGHGVSEFRALPAHDRLRQYREPAKSPRQERGRRSAGRANGSLNSCRSIMC